MISQDLALRPVPRIPRGGTRGQARGTSRRELGRSRRVTGEKLAIHAAAVGPALGLSVTDWPMLPAADHKPPRVALLPGRLSDPRNQFGQ